MFRMSDDELEDDGEVRVLLGQSGVTDCLYGVFRCFGAISLIPSFSRAALEADKAAKLANLRALSGTYKQHIANLHNTVDKFEKQIRGFVRDNVRDVQVRNGKQCFATPYNQRSYDTVIKHLADQREMLDKNMKGKDRIDGRLRDEEIDIMSDQLGKALVEVDAAAQRMGGTRKRYDAFKEKLRKAQAKKLKLEQEREKNRDKHEDLTDQLSEVKRERTIDKEMKRQRKAEKQTFESTADSATDSIGREMLQSVMEEMGFADQMVEEGEMGGEGEGGEGGGDAVEVTVSSAEQEQTVSFLQQTHG